MIALFSIDLWADITKEIYRQHYNKFEASIFDKRVMIGIRRTPIIGEKLVQNGARALGYDDLAVKCMPLTYPFFDRDEEDIKNILKNIESDQCINHINILLEKCNAKPGNLNWAMKVTHEEGKRLEQEKINRTGKAASALEKDTFTAIGFFVRYLIENKCL